MLRDEVLDICRGLAILLVVIGHVPFYTFQVNLIYFFHMPLFFYLSGVTRKKQDAAHSLTAGGRLAANYLIYGLLFSIIGWLFLGQGLYENLLRVLSLKPASIWEITGFGVYWFIVALALLKLTCASETFYRRWPIGLLLFLTIPFLNKTIVSNTALIIFGPAMLGLIFFQMGRFHASVLQLLRQRTWFFVFASALVYFGLAAYSIVAFGGWQHKLVNLAHLDVFNSLLALILSLSGILLTLSIGVLISSFNMLQRILTFYGRHSFIIFVTHLFFVQVLYAVLPQAWWAQQLMLSRIFVLALTLALCTILALFAHKLPWRQTVYRKLLLMR